MLSAASVQVGSLAAPCRAPAYPPSGLGASVNRPGPPRLPSRSRAVGALFIKEGAGYLLGPGLWRSTTFLGTEVFISGLDLAAKGSILFPKVMGPPPISPQIQETLS